MNDKSPFSIRNVRLFILFRLFFNSRFYYPVFTILFLDFGLSVSQFALLNAIWAATIVASEVPSGALADLIGRKSLLMITGSIMVVELGILCIAPVAGTYPWATPQVLFYIFTVNRILSGLAEASASGADEALAYDSLVKEGLKKSWPRVLDLQMRVQSIGFFITMILGAVFYDPELLSKTLGLFGFHIELHQNFTLKIPIFLTFLMGITTLIIAMSMEEPGEIDIKKSDKPSVKETFKLTFKAGKWILVTPLALILITGGLIFDGVIRMVITLASQYYRLIDLPEATFGIIGGLIAATGMIVPKISLKMSKSLSPVTIGIILSLLTFSGLFGMKFFVPYYGLIPAIILFSTMSMVSFFVSNYLNRLADSDKRATILSFKGLAFNLSYGLLGILYSALIAATRENIGNSQPNLEALVLENKVFIESFQVFPWFFLGLISFFILFGVIRYKKRMSKK